jgi:dihydroorotate dehydrogenase
MSRLETKFLGITFPNPFLLAARPPTPRGAIIIEAFKADKEVIRRLEPYGVNGYEVNVSCPNFLEEKKGERLGQDPEAGLRQSYEAFAAMG